MTPPAFRVHESDAFQRWLSQQDRAIVHFHGLTCPFARAFRPAFEQAVGDAPAPLAIRELDLDVDAQWDEHRIEVTPTVVLFEKGREVARLEAGRHVGLAPDAFRSWVKALA